MAFNPGGTDYAGFLRQRAQADEGLTRALDRKGRAEKAARIKKSGERSQFAKIGSAVARGAAAYYTGGLSEQMGGGEMIDEAMLGTDSEGRPIRNEYGGLVKAGSAVYQGSKAQKAGKLGEQDAKFEKLMDRRQANVKMLFDANMPVKAMEAQGKMEDMRLKYDANRKEAEGKGWGGSMLGMSDEDMNIQPSAMTPEQKAAQVTRLNKTPQQLASEKAMLGDEGRRQQGQTMMPPAADAPAAPAIDARPPPQLGGIEQAVQPVSAAQKYKVEGSPMQMQKAKHKQEQDELMERMITGYSEGRSGENRGTSLRDAYKQQASGGADFSNANLTPEEKRRMFLQGHYVN